MSCNKEDLVPVTEPSDPCTGPSVPLTGSSVFLTNARTNCLKWILMVRGAKMHKFARASNTRKAKGVGGAKKGGKPQKDTPPEKTMSDPPHLGTFCPLTPASLRKRFRRVSKSGFQRAILARFCFSARFPPLFGSAQ